MRKKNTEISDRISELIEALGINPNAFAVALGYKRSQTIYDIVNGKCAPSFDFFNKLATSEFASKVNLHWVLTGQGAIFTEPSARTENEVPKPFTPASGVAYPTAEERLEANVADITEPGAAYSGEGSPAVKAVPLYDPGAALEGTGLFAGGALTPVCYLRLPGLPVCDGAMTVRGDAMSPVLCEGDIVLYKWEEEPSDAIEWGRLYLLSLRLGDEEFVTIGYAEPALDPARVRLVRANSGYPPQEISRTEILALARIKSRLHFDPLG